MQRELLIAGVAGGAAYLLLPGGRWTVTPGTRDPEVQSILDNVNLRPCGGESEFFGVTLTERGTATDFKDVFNAHNTGLFHYGFEQLPSGHRRSRPPASCMLKVIGEWMRIRSAVDASVQHFSTSWEQRNVIESKELFAELEQLRRIVAELPPSSKLPTSPWFGAELGLNQRVWDKLQRLAIVLNAAATKHGDPRAKAIGELKDDITWGATRTVAGVVGDVAASVIVSPVGMLGLAALVVWGISKGGVKL